jgi:hypothetical protein
LFENKVSRKAIMKVATAEVEAQLAQQKLANFVSTQANKTAALHLVA